MQYVHFYNIELQLYHDEIVGRLQFVNYKNYAVGEWEESSLMSLSELTNCIELWKADKLLGSFAIGTRLHENATFEIKQKV